MEETKQQDVGEEILVGLGKMIVWLFSTMDGWVLIGIVLYTFGACGAALVEGASQVAGLVLLITCGFASYKAARGIYDQHIQSLYARPQEESADPVDEVSDALRSAQEAFRERAQLVEADGWARQAFITHHREQLASLARKLESEEITPADFEHLRAVLDRHLKDSLTKLDHAAKGVA